MLLLAGLRDTACQPGQNRSGDGQPDEHRGPRPLFEQHTSPEDAQDRPGSSNPGPHTYSATAMRRWKSRGQYRQRRGHDQRRTRPSQRASSDQPRRVGEKQGQGRRESEQRQPRHEHPAATVPVTDRTGRQNEARQNQRITVDYPGQLSLRRPCRDRDLWATLNTMPPLRPPLTRLPCTTQSTSTTGHRSIERRWQSRIYVRSTASLPVRD